MRTLKGLELAYELAKGGDQKMAEMLKRYQDAMLDLQSGKGEKYAVAWLKKRIEEVAPEQAAKLLAEK